MRQKHLSQENLAKAVVAYNELDLREKDHLASCPDCQKAKKDLLADLNLLSEKAQVFRPKSSYPNLSVFAKAPKKSWSFLKPSLVAAGGVLVIMACVILGPRLWNFSGNKDNTFYLTTYVYEKSEAEWTMVEDQPFSPFENFVLGGRDPALDRDWWEFVAPFAEEENLT